MQHLYHFTLNPQAPSHSHLHKPMKRIRENGSCDFPLRRPSWTASELVPRACTCRRPARRPARSPARSDWWWQEGARSIPSAQYRDREPKTSARPKAAGQASPQNEREIHPRAPELQARKEKNRTRMKRRSFHPHARELQANEKTTRRC